MAAVSANVIHHQQTGHVKMHEQSDDDSNDGSLHSINTREKNEEASSSPEYKPASPERNPFMVAQQDYQPVEEPVAVSPDAKLHSQNLQNSPFSMQNVLKMKQERDSVSPISANPCVFSTEKLLENTPNYVRQMSPHMEENHDNINSYSSPPSRRESCSLDEDSPRKEADVSKYRDNAEYDNVYSEDKNIHGERLRDRNTSEDMDENSCCSEDTVLSVGNEAQINNFDNENRTSSTANSQILSPRSSPTPSPASVAQNPVQNLSSFKHIQSHLSAISQLSQNLHTGQHMLLRPNPIAPNPLLFLNQNRLLFNPHHGLQPNIQQVESIHPNHQSLSNSPTGVIPAMSRLSPNESPNQNQLSPTSPGCENKLNLMQNLSNFAVMGQQPGLPSNLRYYKQMPYANPIQMAQHIPALNSGFALSNKHSEDRKNGSKERDRCSNGNNSSVNERLFGSSANHPSSDEARHNLILNHNGLKFSIDNILKADFGRRITDPLHKRSKSGSGKHKFATVNSSAVNPVQVVKPQQPQPLHHHMSLKDSAFSGSAASVKPSSAFLPQSKDSSNNYYKSNPVAASNNLSGARLPTVVQTELKTGGSSSLQNNLVTSSVSSGVSSGASGADKPATGNPIDLSKQDQLPAAEEKSGKSDGPMVWPAWVYCTRYSDRPSSGPRTRRPKKTPGDRSPGTRDEEKRPRTAFSGPQLARLKHEFAENRYLTERRRQQLSAELGLNEAQIKIWFQNKRAKIKKASGQKNPLALQLMAQGLYNHSTIPLSREEEELQELHARETREANA